MSQGYNNTVVAMKVCKLCIDGRDTLQDPPLYLTVQPGYFMSFLCNVSEHKVSLKPAWAIFSGLGSSSHSCSVSGVR